MELKLFLKKNYKEQLVLACTSSGLGRYSQIHFYIVYSISIKMDIKKFLAPTKKKVIRAVILMIFVPLVLFLVFIAWFDLDSIIFSGYLRSLDLIFVPIGLYGGSYCTLFGGFGKGSFDVSCYFLRELLWLVVNGILYYFISCLIGYRKEKQ